MLKVYAYKGCSTCRNAVKWLEKNQIAFTELPIRDTPPSVEELKAMLAAKEGAMRVLFNTSGLDYRALDLKTKLPTLTEADALRLLSEKGNLVKRPFAIDETRGTFLVGFKEAEWAEALA